MAVSLEGVFIILDRASGPMRRMERQAQQTDRAIRRLGETMDKVASPAATRNLDRNSQALRNLGREAQSTERNLVGMGRSTTDVDRRTTTLGSSIKKLGGQFAALRSLIRPTIWTALAAGVTVLVQAVGALIGGATALVPKLLDAGGAIAALPNVIAGAVQAIGGLALALHGVGQALAQGSQMQQQSTVQTQQWADQQRSAHQAVQNAGLALKNAQQGERDAQIALNQAREDARRQLVDLQLAAQGAALGEQRAALTLRQARYQLQQVREHPGQGVQGAMARRDAVLGVREAELGLRQARIDANRADKDSAEAQRKGVQRSDQVRSATEALQQAHQGVAQALQAQADATRQLNETMSAGSVQSQQYQTSLAQLTPSAKRFVNTLLAMRPQLQQLRETAGAALFPGLQRGIQRAARNFGPLQDVVGATNRAIGGAAARFGGLLGSQGFGRDFRDVGLANAQIIERMGGALTHLVSGFRHLSVAAEPFTDWLSRTVAGWARWFDATQRARRATGETEQMFERARRALERFGSIIGNVWEFLQGVFDAARPLGNELWRSADKATERWADFANSVTGQGQLAAYFEGLRGNLHALFELAGALGRAILQMGTDPTLGLIADKLRSGIRPLVDGMSQITRTVGPGLADVFVQIIRLLSHLSGGVFGRFLNLLASVLDTANDILDTFSGLSNVIGSALSFVAVAKFAGWIRQLAGNVGGLAASWGMVATNAGAAAQAEAAAAGAGTVAGAASPGRGPIVLGPGGVGYRTGAALPTNLPIAGRLSSMYQAERAAGAGRIAALGTTAGYGLSRFGAAFRTAEGGLSAASVGGGLLRGGAGLLTGAARFLGPIGLGITALTGLQGALSTEGGLGRKLQGAASNLTFGLVNRPLSTEELSAQGQTSAQEFLQQGARLKDVNARIRDLRTQIADADEFDLAQLRGQLGVLRSARDQMAQAKTQNLIDKFFGGKTPDAAFGGMLDAAKKGGGGIIDQFGQVQREVGRDLRQLPRSGRQEFADLYTAWLNQQAKHHPAIKRHEGELLRDLAEKYGNLGHNVRVVNGRIVTNTKESWRDIVRASESNAERIRQRTKPGLTAVQRQLRAMLMMQGASLTNAGALVRAVEHGTITPAQARGAAEGPPVAGPGGVLVPGMTWPQGPGTTRRPGVSGPTDRQIRRRNRRSPFHVPNPFRRQHGGPVTPGNAFLVGEDGPELFVPPQPGAIHPNRGGAAGTIAGMMGGGAIRGRANVSRTPLQDVADRGAKELRDGTKRWTRLMQGGLRDQNDLIGDFRDKTSDDFNRVQRNVTDSVTRGSDNAKKQWDQMHDQMLRQNDDMLRSTQQKFGAITNELRDALQGLGLKGNELQAAMTGRTPKGGGGGGKNKARGGRIGGSGLLDTVNVGGGAKAAPGELIVNRHTEGRVNAMLGGRTTLGREVAGETRAHSQESPRAAALKRYLQQRAQGRAFASGGRMIDPAWDPGTERLNEAISSTVGAWARKYHADMTAGYDPGDSHVSPGHNVTGTATDMVPLGGWTSSGTRLFEQGLRAIEGHVDQLLYGTAGIGTPYPNHGRGNHAHIEWGMHPNVAIKGAPAVGGRVPRLKRQMGYQGPGTARRAASQRALDNYLAAAQKRLGAPTGAVKGGSVPAQIARVLFAHGLDKVAAAGIIGNAYAESSWDPGATGYGGGGLWGFTASPNSLADLQAYAQNKGTPWTNVATQTEFLLKHVAGSTLSHLNAANTAAQAATIFMTEFERPGIPRLDVRIAAAERALRMGYAKGGRIPWLAEGADFTAHDPMTIGVGDGPGSERVRVTPSGRGTAGAGRGVNVNVRIGHITHNQDGDIKRVVKKEVGEALQELAEELPSSMTDDSDLVD